MSFLSLTLSIPLLAGACVAAAAELGEGYPKQIEVFTTTRVPVSDLASSSASAALSGTEIQAYPLDGIRQVEVRLSEGLPGDPVLAKRRALQRIQGLEAQTTAEMQHSAIGLAKAVQYGLDRYPAIVLDGEAVIYGVTDIEAALYRYRSWQEGREP